MMAWIIRSPRRSQLLRAGVQGDGGRLNRYLTKDMKTPPSIIRAIRQDQVFELQWDNGPLYRVPFKLLRFNCPCATCIDEFTGRRVLKFESIPDAVAPVEMNFVGNYALKITWSDSHSTGLYTWDHLAVIAERTGKPDGSLAAGGPPADEGTGTTADV